MKKALTPVGAFFMVTTRTCPAACPPGSRTLVRASETPKEQKFFKKNTPDEPQDTGVFLWLARVRDVALYRSVSVPLRVRNAVS